jgi:molybdopterin converting factor subunit 1
MARMKVNVRLFATLRERAGAASIDIELPERATVDDALDVLRERAELAEALDRLPLRLAVNREYALPGAALQAGDELALITPVSGGR